MSIASQVVLEMYGATKPATVVVMFPPTVDDPIRCQRRTQKRVKRLGHGFVAALETRAIVAACGACMACTSPR